MYLPNDVVDANDALWLLLVVDHSGLGDDPAVATIARQKAVAIRLRLALGNHCKQKKHIKFSPISHASEFE